MARCRGRPQEKPADVERERKVNGRGVRHHVRRGPEFADALATAICVLGAKKGLALIAGLKRIEALAIDLQGKVHTTDGLAGLKK